MTRLAQLLLIGAGVLVGCGTPPASPAPPPPSPTTAWIAGMKPWYCGTESLPPRVGADGVSTPQARDVALKIVPGKDSFTVIYASLLGAGAASGSANDKSIGTMTRFAAAGERGATLRWENDQKQKGDAALAFSPDFATVTVTWTPSATPPGSSPVPPAPTTLAAAAGSSACVAGTLIR
ncbi:MAG: hypothetical protein V4850_07730 [Myxococcota bacterium]